MLLDFLQNKVLKGLSALNLRKINFLWLSKKSKKWLDGDAIGMDIEDVASFHWKTSNYCTLVFNKNVQFVKKNIDICILKCRHDEWEKAMLTASCYTALGELKGGIDPGWSG